MNDYFMKKIEEKKQQQTTTTTTMITRFSSFVWSSEIAIELEK